MDVVAGHFGYLEHHSSSKPPFPFTGETTSIARASVKRAKEKEFLTPLYNPNANDPVTTRANDGESMNSLSTEELCILI